MKALGETPAFGENTLDVVGAFTDALILGLAMIGIMIAFAVLALQIIVTLLEFKIVTLGGFVLLPFGIWSKSSFLAERPLGFVVSSGLKVLALAIVVSGARSVFDQLQPSANPDLYEALAILAASLLLAMLALFIPNLAAALVSGGPALGAGALASGALAVGGAAVGAVAGTTGLGAATANVASRFRAAAGAMSGRTPPAGSAPPGASPGGTPSAGPSPRGPGGSGSGGAPPPGGATGLDGGTVRPTARSTPASPDRTGPAPSEATPSAPAEPGADGATPRASETIAKESDAARRDFHRAAQDRGQGPQARPRSGRGAALQAFFVANAGRALLPGNETSGAISPQLRDEET